MPGIDRGVTAADGGEAVVTVAGRRIYAARTIGGSVEEMNSKRCAWMHSQDRFGNSFLVLQAVTFMFGTVGRSVVMGSSASLQPRLT